MYTNFFLFFNYTAPTGNYTYLPTLSLHDALPILRSSSSRLLDAQIVAARAGRPVQQFHGGNRVFGAGARASSSVRGRCRGLAAAVALTEIETSAVGLQPRVLEGACQLPCIALEQIEGFGPIGADHRFDSAVDRKSTRLNSSH